MRLRYSTTLHSGMTYRSIELFVSLSIIRIHQVHMFALSWMSARNASLKET